LSGYVLFPTTMDYLILSIVYHNVAALGFMQARILVGNGFRLTELDGVIRHKDFLEFHLNPHKI